MTTMAIAAQEAFLPATIRRRRLIGAAVAVGAAVLLGVAAWLTPAAEGLGTHRQMGLPECGWIMILDMPCPTCGMTTAFAFAAEGRFGAAFVSQPLGALLAVATTMSLLVGSFVAMTGSRVGTMLGRLWRPRTGWVIAGLIVAAWVFKVLVYKGMLS